MTKLRVLLVALVGALLLLVACDSIEMAGRTIGKDPSSLPQPFR